MSFHQKISIHAPLTGCDPDTHSEATTSVTISIHAPLTGCDANAYGRHLATYDFNPRTPHGVRPLIATPIMISAPFQSTHPSRGATIKPISISIVFNNFNPRTPHGVRRERSVPRPRLEHFNPRTPHGVRLQTCIKEVIPIWLLEQYIDMFLRISSFILFFFVPTGKLLYNNLPFWSANLLCKTCVPHPRTA